MAPIINIIDGNIKAGNVSESIVTKNLAVPNSFYNTT